MANDAPKAVSRSAINFFLGTTCSRIFGFLREVALGAWFGVSPLLAAFFIAYRFSQLLRRFFGESALLSSFSPHFEELKLSDPQKASSFFRDLFASLSSLLCLLILLLEIALFSCWKWLALSDTTSATLLLTMIMLPGVFFISLYALFSALLQSNRTYFLPGLAPTFFNLTFLIVLWHVKEWDTLPATLALAIGTTIAFFVQSLSVALGSLSFLKTITWKEVKLWSSELKGMIAAMGLTLIGTFATQLNTFIDTLFARGADPSGPAFLYYAIRLSQLPLALFGLALSSALLPPLTRAVSDPAHFSSLVHFALRRSLFWMVPAAMLLLVCGDVGVNFVYGRGAFTHAAIFETTRCLWGYSLGLIPSVLILIVAPAFYARKDFKTPLKASLLSIGINCLLNAALIYGLRWGPASVAVATSLAAWFNCIYLFRALTRQGLQLQDTGVMRVAFGSLLAAAVVAAVGHLWMGGGVVLVLKEGAVHLFARGLWAQLREVFVYGTVFAAVFFACVWPRVQHVKDQ